MNIEKIKELDRKYYMKTFGERTNVAFKKGKGIRLVSTEGEKFYDFFGGIAVNSLGYGHRRFCRALTRQVRRLIHTSSVYYVENQARLAAVIAENSCADRVFFCSTGAEANEGAIKIAKKHFFANGENRCEFITLKNSFHGRTLATVAATGQEKYQKPYAPLIEKFVHIEPNDCEALRSAVSEKTAGIMLELIQGESGVRPLSEEFVALADELCKKFGAYLIIDEVQTGVGRTGKMFAYEHYGIEPDIFTLAKGLGGGVPIGAVCAKGSAADAFGIGDHGTTFGGNPLSTCAGLAVMKEMTGGVIQNAKEVGAYLRGRLEEIKGKNSKIAEVRGMGLMIGVEFNDDIAKEIGKALFDEKILVGVVGARVLRIVPPLILKREEADILADALDRLV